MFPKSSSRLVRKRRTGLERLQRRAEVGLDALQRGGAVGFEADHDHGGGVGGAGQAEAPRGTLMHNYKVDENGLITWANLVIATGQNNNAMNKGVTQAAQHYIKGGKFTEGILNRIEAVVRTFDPCLSCSTHAFGQMPLALTLVNADGEVVDQLVR